MIFFSFFKSISTIDLKLILFRRCHFLATDTIFALSTAHGRSAIAVFRISGQKALATLNAFTYKSIEHIQALPRKMLLTKFFNPENGELLDVGLSCWFPAVSSFTGEDVVEFHVHGSPAVVRDMYSALGKMPTLRLAKQGEFTKRSFLNQKIDLVEAEGLADLLRAETSAQRQIALQHSNGILSQRCICWRDKLLTALAHIEAAIDFGEDELINDNVVLNAMSASMDVCNEIRQHLLYRKAGERIRNGIRITLAGPPNSGKSSLLNLLCQRSVSIVSPISGTTRDAIEVAFDLDGFAVLLCDTAGLRHTADEIEKEGVLRAHLKIESSDVIIFMLDYPFVLNCEATIDEYIRGIFGDTILKLSTNGDDIRLIILLNKCDLLSDAVVIENRSDNFVTCNDYRIRSFFVSCQNRHGISDFIAYLSFLVKDMCSLGVTGSNVALTRERHYMALESVCQNLKQLENMDAVDCVIAAACLRSSLHDLKTLVGGAETDDILNKIFSDFCIGK